MLEGNRSRIQNLTGGEIWMFIAGRVLLSFGAGVLVMTYFPAIATHLAWPSLIIGALLFIVALKGMFRRAPKEPAP